MSISHHDQHRVNQRENNSGLRPFFLTREYLGNRVCTVPFTRERETRQTDKCTASPTAAAAKTLGLTSLPQPLDLAGQGRSYHIRC